MNDTTKPVFVAADVRVGAGYWTVCEAITFRVLSRHETLDEAKAAAERLLQSHNVH